MTPHQHKERLLKWYEFDESGTTRIAFPASATALPSFITSVTLDDINQSDRINLAATIQWTVTLTGTTNGAAGTLFQILAFQQATFQIWRDTIGGSGALIREFTDTGDFAGIGNIASQGLRIPVTVEAPNAITTDITGTDVGVSNHKHTYYLTVTIPATNASGAIGGLLIVNSTAKVVSPLVVGWHFAGAVVDENDT